MNQNQVKIVKLGGGEEKMVEESDSQNEIEEYIEEDSEDESEEESEEDSEVESEEESEEESDNEQHGGKKKKPKAPSVSSRSSSSASSSSSLSSSTMSADTVELLSRDPLYLVLSQFFHHDDKNIVEVLCELNENIKSIKSTVEKFTESFTLQSKK